MQQSLQKNFAFGIRNIVICRFMAALGLLAVVLSTARAEMKFDTLKVGSITYSNVTVIDANASDLYFKYSGGMANVKLRDLPPEIQKRFNYDPDAAANAEQQSEENASRYVPNFSPAYSSQAPAAAESDDAGPADTNEVPRLADSATDNSPLDKPAPAVNVEKWLTDKPVTADKSVLVFFWKPQSAPCRRAIPDLNDLQKKYPDTLVVIGITTESEKDISQMTDPHMDFASGIDSQGSMLHAADISTVPSVLLIDPKGIVRYAGHPAALKDAALDKILSP
jgi:thiol-disulfide isomerase/thioredoxin